RRRGRPRRTGRRGPPGARTPVRAPPLLPRGRPAAHRRRQGPPRRRHRPGRRRGSDPAVTAPRRVAVTGTGAITAAGPSVDALIAAVRAGRSVISLLAGDEFADLPVRIGGQITGFAPPASVDRGLRRRLSPVQLWAIAAADQALHQAGVPT